MVTLLNRARKNRRAAFTLIELLVVVLILGILLAVAIPLYLSSVRNSAKQTVKANMKIIATAMQAYKVKGKGVATTKAQLWGPTVESDLQAWPTGPRGVTYDVVELGTKVQAQENAEEDVFGEVGTKSEKAFYDLTTGLYTGIEPAAATP